MGCQRARREDVRWSWLVAPIGSNDVFAIVVKVIKILAADMRQNPPPGILWRNYIPELMSVV